MSLRDRLEGDIQRVFINLSQFGETHMWNDTEIRCVLDSDTALKRKNNNVVDISWDFSSEEIVLYAEATAFPQRPRPQQTVMLDRNQWTVLQVGEDEGMLNVLLARKAGKMVQ
jgi:hypothetical protein